MQRKVLKADGSVEQYLHTKVIGTFCRALACTDGENIFAAEQFAEAITFYLYNKRDAQTIKTEEIHLMIQAVLDSAGFQDASCALAEYHLSRKLRRRRIEVTADEQSAGPGTEASSCQWDKSQIVNNLTDTGLERNLARTIASAVEEKVLSLGMTKVRCSLIKQLVLADTDAMLQAEMHLHNVAV